MNHQAKRQVALTAATGGAVRILGRETWQPMGWQDGKDLRTLRGMNPLLPSSRSGLVVRIYRQNNVNRMQWHRVIVCIWAETVSRLFCCALLLAFNLSQSAEPDRVYKIRRTVEKPYTIIYMYTICI